MAKKKLAIVFGQSNATAVADAKTFEDANPLIALRSPRTLISRTPMFALGGVDDRVVLPDSFPGFESLSVCVVAIPTIKVFTPYNPSATHFETIVASANGPTPPGRTRVVAPAGGAATAATFELSLRWQYSPVGLVLTRRRTNTQHTITAIAATPGSRVTVSPACNPPVDVGEEWNYPLVAGANSVGLDYIVFANQFGGYHDPGGRLEAQLGYPLATVGAFDLSVWEVAFPSTSGRIECPEHVMWVGRRVRFSTLSGTLPVDVGTGLALSTSSDYYVVKQEPPDDGTPASHYSFYISATPSGDPITFSGLGSGAHRISCYPMAAGTLVGMQVRCTSGANVGETRTMTSLTFNEGGGIWSAYVTPAFSNLPQSGDTYEITPPPDADGNDVAFEDWGYFLPMTQFRGHEVGLPASLLVTFVMNSGSTTFAPTVPLYNGAPVRFYERKFADGTGTPSGAAWPASGILRGKTYYVVNATPTTFQVSATYDGSPIVLPAAAAATHWLQLSETWVDRYNPLPPGFNYANVDPSPVPYQPLFGASTDLAPTRPAMGITMGIANRLQELLGEEVYVINVAFGGTSLAHREVSQTAVGGHGSADSSGRLSWAPGGDDDCYAALIRTVRAAISAAKKDGDTLELALLCNLQGESDATTENMALRYRGNLDRFVTKLTSDLRDLGIWSGSASTIPWVQPLISDAWEFYETVNQAIIDVSATRPNMRYATFDGLTFVDGVHYDGISMHNLAGAIVDEWLQIRTNSTIEIEVCNLALAMIGESARVTSIDPPDSSAQAALCAQFYPVARDEIIEMHPWAFASAKADLVAVESDRDEWSYAFALPVNFGGVIALGPDVAAVGELSAPKIAHAIEINNRGDSVLYCQQQTVAVRYKMRVVDPSKFTPIFKRALAKHLASMLVGPTVKGVEAVQIARALQDDAMRLIAKAEAVDARQTRDLDLPDLGWRR